MSRMESDADRITIAVTLGHSSDERIVTPDEVFSVSMADHAMLQNAIRQTNRELQQGSFTRPVSFRIVVDGIMRIWPLLRAELEKAGWEASEAGPYSDWSGKNTPKITFWLSEKKRVLTERVDQDSR